MKLSGPEDCSQVCNKNSVALMDYGIIQFIYYWLSFGTL